MMTNDCWKAASAKAAAPPETGDEADGLELPAPDRAFFPPAALPLALLLLLPLSLLLLLTLGLLLAWPIIPPLIGSTESATFIRCSRASTDAAGG